ncbi:MAG: transglycosylase domain-containing protein [Bacteroidales bacterium]|nr:transglycosylase domain-containing protein [Candidatus Cacconaster merdequi]
MKDYTKRKIVKAFWIVVLAPAGVLLLSLLLVGLFAKIPSFEQLENPESNLATLLVSEDGKVISTYHIENRSFVQYEDLPEHIVNAAIATEDARFRKHSGIDFRGLARVGVKTLLMGDSSQGGGSTITQQLAKTLFPRESIESRIPGGKYFKMLVIKMKEWITAVKLERNYTKDEIVTMYLNQIFFGGNAYGIKSAARTFFAKDTRELTVEEGACLVGMVNKPTRYNPVINPEQSLKRRNHVIHQMCKYGYLSKAERDSLSTLPIELNYQMQDHNAGLAPYFRDMLRRYMNANEPKASSYAQVEDYRVDSLSWKEDPLYGWLNKNLKPDGSQYDLDRDGLKIYTTLDSRMQEYAEFAVKEHLGKDLQKTFEQELKGKRNAPFSNDVSKDVTDLLMKQAVRWSDRYRGMKKEGCSESEIDKAFRTPAKMRVFAWNEKGYKDTTMTPMDSIKYYKSFLRSAFIAIEPNTGHVKAYVGGPDYRFFKYDNARQGKRQVGSTMKPFLYTLAMQEGFSPCDRVANRPYSFELADTVWTPKSTDKAEYIGKIVTLKWGLTHSSNNISAYLMKQFGPLPMVEMARKMGIGSYLDPVYSLCVGSCDLSVYEMVAAYNTFPSRGIYCYPMLVTRIEDSEGNILANFTTRRREAISDPTAYLMVNLMQGVVNEGTAGRLKWKYGLEGELAGKTGTTNDQSDGWFIGYTPKLTAGVWVGAEDRQVHFESLYYGGGANMALPIWGLFMQKVYQDPTIPIGKDDTFVPPLGWNVSLNCTGSDSDMVSGSRKEDDFFD